MPDDDPLVPVPLPELSEPVAPEPPMLPEPVLPIPVELDEPDDPDEPADMMSSFFTFSVSPDPEKLART
jgi:hypothetical protein